MDKLNRTDECVTIGRCKICRLLFAGGLVLPVFLNLASSTHLMALQAACDICIAGMKLSTSKTEVLHLSRNPVQCFLQVGAASLKQVEKFKYLRSHIHE